MRLHSETGRTKRSRIEQGIRKIDVSLFKINEDRLRPASELAGFKLLRRLMASRSHADRSRSGNRIRWENGGFVHEIVQSDLAVTGSFHLDGFDRARLQRGAVVEPLAVPIGTFNGGMGGAKSAD
jgi:hypothetical protein